MPYTDHYEKYLNEIPGNIEKCKETGDRIVFGYTSDLDVLLTYNEDEFNKLVDTYVKGDIYRDGDENITDLESFSRIIAYYMANGLGGEADITDHKVVEYLLEHFVANYSQKFMLLHIGYSANMCAGAIVKQASSFRNFNDLLVEILANSNIVLNEDSALEYLRQQGYIARRRYSDIGRIVTEAKVVRSKKG